MSIQSVAQEKEPLQIEGLANLWQEGWELPRFSRWGLVCHHCAQAWSNFLSFPVTTAITLLSVGLSLILFGGFLMARENIEHALAGAQQELTMSIFFRDETSAAEIEKLSDELKASVVVASVAFVEKKDALSRFRAELGEHAIILDGLEDQNPLPASLEIKFKEQEGLLEAVRSLGGSLALRPVVEYVDFGEGLLGKLSSFMSAFRLLGMVAVACMLIITSFMITSTIKLAVYAQREALEIMRLVGATEWFIRAPFIIEGIFVGIFGALISLLLLYGIWLSCQELVAQADIARTLLPNVEFLSLSGVASVILVGALVSVAGVFFAVRSRTND